MEQLKRLIREIHQRSLWQVLGIYVASAWVVFEVVQTVTEGLGLPDWFPSFALVLLLVGLPIVLATAFVQEDDRPIRASDPTLIPEHRDKEKSGEPRDQGVGLRPFLTWRKALLGGLMAFALWGVVAAGWLLLADRGRAEREDFSAVESGSEGARVAVLPFEVTGPEMDVWREGMVHLLSSNLDGIGGIRRSDPRAILGHWRSLQDEAGLPGSTIALRTARRVGAEVAVTGRAVTSGARLRLSAEIRDVDDGEVLARAQLEGEPDSILSLADRLTLDLLGTGHLTSEVQLSKVTLSGLRDVPLPALRHFLDGERHYQRGNYGEAIEGYLKAVGEDSTFALAYYRISDAYGWREGGEPQSREWQRIALRHADNLPPRARRLLHLNQLRQARLVEVIPAAEDFTRRYPDDVEGWNILGEVYTHVGPRALEPIRKLRAPFHRALALDPYYGNAYIHLIQEAFFQGDSSRARALVDSFAAVSPQNPRLGGYRLAYPLIWDDTLSREDARSMLRAADSRDLWNVQSALDKSPRYADELMVVGRIESESERSVEDRLHGARDLYWAYRYRGRLQEARQARETELVLQDDRNLSAEMRRLDLHFYIWGYGEIDAARRAREALSGNLSPHDHFYLAALAADEADWREAEHQIEQLEAMTSERAGPARDTAGGQAQGVLQAIRVYAAARRGDLDRAMEAYQEPMPYLDDDAHAVLTYRLGVLLLEAGRTREAEPYFVSLIDNLNKTPFQVLSQYQLGRTYEALGEPDRAKLYYGRFVSWWENCDPHLRPLWQRAREALARLTGETV